MIVSFGRHMKYKRLIIDTDGFNNSNVIVYQTLQIGYDSLCLASCNIHHSSLSCFQELLHTIVDCSAILSTSINSCNPFFQFTKK